MKLLLCFLLAICLYPFFKEGLIEFLVDVGLVTIVNNEENGDENGDER